MTSVAGQQEVKHFRTLFLSDIHLGSKAAKADFLLDFLKYHEADTIILVGDIVDGWRLKRSWYWPQDCNDVVQKLLRKARKGTRIVYIPGNHDEFLRDFPGMHFGGIEVAERMIHEGADGRRYLVLHGDEFDVVVRNARLLAYLGDWAYDMAIMINVVLAGIRRRLGMPYWSFSAWAKLQVKHAANFIGEFHILNGLFQVDAAWAIIASSGVALAAFYALRMYQLTMHNPLPDGADSRELSLRDALVLIPMVAIVVVLAFCPQLIVHSSEQAVDSSVAVVREVAK